MTRSKWFQPLFAVAIGVVLLVAQWSAGNPGAGLVSLGIMAVFGAIILVGGSRSETIRGLRGDGVDERFKQIGLQATALTGIVVISAILIAFVVQLARGEDAAPYSWLGAIGGLAYVVSIVVLRLRR